MGSGRRVPIGTCPSLDYAQRIRRQYQNLSGQTTAQDLSVVSPLVLEPRGRGRIDIRELKLKLLLSSVNGKLKAGK